MTNGDQETPEASLLVIRGDAADHLYREGSAKAGFWEVLFGSRLAPEKRTRVSALPDGTRRFDVPTFSVQPAVIESLRRWGTASPASEVKAAVVSAIDHGPLRLTLVGLQPRGVAVAAFSLVIASAEGAPDAGPALREGLAAWWASEGARLRGALVEFGFTPRPA